MKKHVAGYGKATAAVENLSDVLMLVGESGSLVMNVEPAFARGLEYYTGLIFEVYIPELEIALGGGGRYDRLIEVFGGDSTPAVGCAHGIDRIALAMQMQKTALASEREKRVVVIPINEAMKVEALKIAQMLRAAMVTVEFEVMGRKMAKALEDANKRKVDYAVIVGERELKEKSVVLKNFAKFEQSIVTIEQLIEKIKS
jgi:histidyl-tRNA synthetase